jgi:hypothetical protein
VFTYCNPILNCSSNFFSGFSQFAFCHFGSLGKPSARFPEAGRGRFFWGKKNGGKMPAAGFLLSSLGVVLSSQHLPSHPAATGCGLLPVDQEPSFANRSVSAPYASPRQQTAETR